MLFLLARITTALYLRIQTERNSLLGLGKGNIKMAQRNSILKNFDMDALRKKRASISNGKTDLAAALRQIAPEIEKLNVGETAKIIVPEDKRGDGLRGFVMSITAKISNLTPKGEPWAGRVYDSAASVEGDILYVQRGKDETPKPRKRGGPPTKAEKARRAEEAKAAEEAAKKDAEKATEGKSEVDEGGATVVEQPES